MGGDRLSPHADGCGGPPLRTGGSSDAPIGVNHGTACSDRRQKSGSRIQPALSTQSVYSFVRAVRACSLPAVLIRH